MKNSQAKIWFIFITVMIDMMGIGLIVPVWPTIIKRFIADPSLASEYFGYFASLYALMQFFFSPLLGKLSDKYGRRPVLLLSLFIAAIDYTVMAFAPQLWILFLGRALAGATGANHTIAMAYVADISSKDESAGNFGKVGAAFGLGFILGPALGGLISVAGPKAPFLAAAILNLANFLFGLFVLPESLPPLKRNSFGLKELNPFLSLKNAFLQKGLILLFIVHFLFQLAGLTHPSIWSLYTSFRYSWSSAQIGASLAVVGLLSALVQGGLTSVVIKKFGINRTVNICLFGSAFAFLCYGLANTSWMLYATLFSTAIFWVAGPALQSFISAEATPGGKGELQGILVSLTSMAAILNPIIVTHLFALFTRGEQYHLPGAPYFFASIVSLFAGLLLFFRSSPKELGNNLSRWP